MSDKPEAVQLTGTAHLLTFDQIPDEAKCQRPRPHAPHNHDIKWSFILGAYWCDGR